MGSFNEIKTGMDVYGNAISCSYEGIKSHKGYEEKIQDYPSERKAVIPIVI